MILCIIFAGLLHIIGLATPYWHTITLSNVQHSNIESGHHGLFVECTSIVDTVDCIANEAKGIHIFNHYNLEIYLSHGIACFYKYLDTVFYQLFV